MAHVRQLLKAVENPPSTSELEEISDYAIDCILEQACTEPENREILSIPPPERGTMRFVGILTVGFFTWLGKLIFKNREQE
jgi:hypothetical protein